ncbi:hypothetical protein Tco_0971913, partial [Tanacetum coccineum]
FLFTFISKARLFSSRIMAYDGKNKLKNIVGIVEAMGIKDTARVLEISGLEVCEKVSEYLKDMRKMIQDHDLDHKQHVAAKLAEPAGSLLMELAKYKKEVESALANEGMPTISNPNGESDLKTMIEKDESVQETEPVLGISTMSKDQESETSIKESVLLSLVARASGNMSAEKEEAVKETDPALRTSATNIVHESKTSTEIEERGESVLEASGGIPTVSNTNQESYLKMSTRKEVFVQETTDPVLGTSAMTKDQGSDTSIKESVSGTLVAGASGNMPTMYKSQESEPVLGTSAMNKDQESIKIEKDEGGELVSRALVAGTSEVMSAMSNTNQDSHLKMLTKKEESGECSRVQEVKNDERKSHEPASGTTISSSGEMSTMSTVGGTESEQRYAYQEQQSVNGSALVVGSASSNQSATEIPLARSGNGGISDEKQEVGYQSIQRPDESASSASHDQDTSTHINPSPEPPLMTANHEGAVASSSNVLGIHWPTLEQVKGLKKRGKEPMPTRVDAAKATPLALDMNNGIFLLLILCIPYLTNGVDFNQPAVFNFGDSNSDTADLVAGVGDHLDPPNVDAMDLPFLNAYLEALGVPNFRKGCDFAAAEFKILPATQYSVSPFSFGIQVA